MSDKVASFLKSAHTRWLNGAERNNFLRHPANAAEKQVIPTGFEIVTHDMEVVYSDETNSRKLCSLLPVFRSESHLDPSGNSPVPGNSTPFPQLASLPRSLL